MTQIIDGKKHADSIRAELKDKVSKMEKKPGFAVILVGDRKDSMTYVKMKEKASQEIGIRFNKIELPESVDQGTLNDKIIELNNNPDVHGIIVQLPLPKHLDEEIVIRLIKTEKDVDGMTIQNLGELARLGGKPTSMPCTAVGCMELLDREGVETSGKNAVMIGRSNIVGMPTALSLNNKDATVTICHLKTPENVLKNHCLNADIIIVAAGCPYLVKAEWIKDGAVIIDVGINAIEDSTKRSGYRLVGDADYHKIIESGKASKITPVPGGVGPMTVAMLMNNVVRAFERS